MPERIHEVLLTAQSLISERLKLQGAEARIESQVLLQETLNVNLAWLIAHRHEELECNEYNRFRSLLERRLEGEPIAYILGYKEFYGLKLQVSPATLIPRQDTETLVDLALKKISKVSEVSILDLGTGSGAIALAIASQRPNATILATDVSEEALKIAVSNANLLKLENIRFELGSWLNPTGAERFDFILSNPPYISLGDEHLGSGDLRYEPLGALISGVDGLKDIQAIVNSAADHLNPLGWLMLEHGYKQSEEVADLMAEAGFKSISHERDIAGIPRVTLGQHSVF